jgi:hypothetical protein
MGGLKTYRSTIDFLGDQTAKQIADTIQQYYVQQGWAAGG